MLLFRDTQIGFLRQMSTPDPPTFIPQVLPTKEQQLHQQSDLKSFLKKPYVFDVYNLCCALICTIEWSELGQKCSELSPL